MKFIKGSLKIIAVLLALLLTIVFVVIAINTHNTVYLKISNHPGLNNNSYLITHVNIIPMTQDTVLRNKSVLVKEGIIVNIDDSISLSGIEVINGGGKYLSPGLIDMHIHLWDKQELGLYLANGVTAVRNLWGYPMHLRIKKSLNNNEIMGPSFFTAGPKLTGAQDYGDDKVQVNSPEEAKQLVIEYKKRGFDFIKIYAGLTPELFDAITEQSKVSGISIAEHPNRNMPYLSQFNPQIKSLEHAEEIVQQGMHFKLDSSKLDPIIQKFKTTNTSFCPTLIGYYKIYEMLEQGDDILNSEMAHYINPLVQKVDSKVQTNRWVNEKQQNPSITQVIYKQHQFHLYILKKMSEEGVNIISGTDAGIGVTAPGFSIHEELELYHKAGLSNYEALKTATVNPSKTHKVFNQMGTIETGKVANFVLTSGNPLDNLGVLRTPEMVMVKGRKLDQKILNEFVTKARDRKNMLATALNYAEYLLVER